MRRIWRAIFGSYCTIHGRSYRSDFCGLCMRQKGYRSEVEDRRRVVRPESPDSAWPLKRSAR